MSSDVPNFEARITAGATLTVWVDVATAKAPTRLNPNPVHPPKYQRVTWGDTVTVKATVNGVEGPLDAQLGGTLFKCHFAEVPIWPPVAITSPPGQSSVATFKPKYVGHHLLVMRREDGGAVGVPFFVEPSS